uniref:Uncharacterized protein n=1 Tax=Panagrolaimus sp. PS1159 TaxID=55785 RepID=A0AC35FGY6_9BILA
MGDRKKRHSIEKARKGSSSMSAQLSRTARRFSSVIAPQLTKFDFVPSLQANHEMMSKLLDIKTVHNALENYIIHNATNFDPIDFEIVTPEAKNALLRAQLFADEFVLFENQKRLVSIIFGDPDSGVDGPVVAKIRHPVSGMKMYEIVDLQHNGNWQIISSMDEGSRCQIDSTSNFFRRIMSMCGITFVPKWWLVRNETNEIGKVLPQNSFWKENALVLHWAETVDNEIRLLILSFAMVQMIREGFPQLFHIIKENRIRRIP